MITVTAAIIQTNGKTLAARKKSGLPLAGLWEFPGGKIEPGETPEESLKRELEEELGILCRIGQYFGESIYDYNDKVVHLLGYLVTPVTTSFTLTDHDEIRWLTPEELFSVNWAPADLPLVEKLLAKNITDRTLHFYDTNAETYICQTIDIDMETIRERFTALLPEKGHILDLGCGSGRDSKAFLEMGFTVTATDASPAVAAITSQLLRQDVRIQKAQEIDEVEKYDGIWACASLLHIPESEFSGTLTKIVSALKPLGILYLSLKKEPGRQWDARGRFFNNLPEEQIVEIVHSLKPAELLDMFETSSRMDEREEKWLNFLVRKIRKSSGQTR